MFGTEFESEPWLWPRSSCSTAGFALRSVQLTEAGSKQPCKHSQNHAASKTRKTFSLTGGSCGTLSWHFLSDSQPNQHVTGSWCLPFRLLVHCGHVSCFTGVGRRRTGFQMFVLFQWKQMFSTYILTHTLECVCTSTTQCLGTLPKALMSVTCYQLKTGSRKYLVWRIFKHSVRVFFYLFFFLGWL